MNWDDATLKRLRAYWAEGLSIRVIGLKFGCSKNSVVGKVHRLKLPSRLNPIAQVYGPPLPRKVRAETAIDLPPLPGRMTMHKTTVFVGRLAKSKEEVFVRVERRADANRDFPLDRIMPISRRDEKISETPALPIFRPIRARNACQFITSDDRPWRFCDAVAEAGDSYCTQHRVVCRVPTRAQKEQQGDAA